jgi:hypothetical protein
MPHATVGRPEQVPRAPASGQHAHRGRRAEPVQLAGGRDRPGPRAAPAEEARARPGGAAAAAAALAGRGGQSGQGGHAPGRRLRGRPRRLLAGALAAGPRHRGARHPPHQRRGLPRAPAGQDRPARHRAAQARLPRLAAGRTGPLRHGRRPDPRGGGRPAPQPRARGPGRRAHPHREPGQGRPGPPRDPRLQADAAERGRAPGDAAHARGARPRGRRFRRTPWPSCGATWHACTSWPIRSGRSRRPASRR